MPIQQIFVHGNAVMMTSPGDLMLKAYDLPWSDIVGLPGEAGKAFRRRGDPHRTSYFQAPIPTPTFRGPALDVGQHCKLLRVGVKFTSEAGVQLVQILLYRGAEGLPDIRVNSIEGPRNGWEPNVNSFLVPSQPHIWDGLNISLGFRFLRDGHIHFHAVGADFEVAA